MKTAETTLKKARAENIPTVLKPAKQIKVELERND